MSFVYGGIDTNDLAGVTATLTKWPSLGGLSVDTSETPGTNGVVYGGHSHSSVSFTFEVDIEGDSVQQVFDRRDEFIRVIEPSRGPRDLVVEGEADWFYPDVLASTDIAWDRAVWISGTILRGDVSFQTVGVASAREIEPTAYDATGVVEFTAGRGNTASYPTIMLPSGGDLVVQINDFELQLNDTPQGLTAALDYDAFRFDLLDTSGNRVESLVPYMDHYDRASISPGAENSAQVTDLDSPDDPVTFIIYPNERRI